MAKSQYRYEMEKARTRLAGGSKILPTRLGPVEYTEYGEGLPVLIIHGNGGGYDQGLMIAKTFIGSGFHCICPSRFGYLRSPLPEGMDATPAVQTEVFASLLDALDIERTTVVAFSDGGPSALQFAIRYPERCSGLIMVAAKSSPPPSDSGIQSFFFNTMLRSDFLYWSMTYKFRPFLLSLFGLSKEVQSNFNKADEKLVVDTVECMHPISLRKKGIFNDRKWMSSDTLRIKDYPLQSIKAPTLVFHAKDDGLQPFYHAQHAASNIPGARLYSLERGGHLLVGHIEEIKQEIAEFVNGN